MSMVTVLQQHQGNASVDFSVKRSKALSFLAACGINAGTPSENQLQVFQDQELEIQKNFLRLFQEYGPSQLMAVARDAASPSNLANDSEFRSTTSSSLQHLSYSTIPQFAGFSNGDMPNGSGKVPCSSSHIRASPLLYIYTRVTNLQGLR